MQEELVILEQYIQQKGLRNTPQRNKILEVFLRYEQHISAEDLYSLVKKKYPEIGQATVFRSVKTFCEAGLASKLLSENGVIMYEHAYKHQKHGHLICTKCSNIIEFDDPLLIKLQNKISDKNNFKADNLTVKITGLCQSCLRKIRN